MPRQGTQAHLSVSVNHSLNDDEADGPSPDYVQLSDLSAEGRPRATGVLNTLAALGISPEALGQAGDIEQLLKALLTKELSCSRYFRWAALDNLVEKILQGLVLNKQDISQEEINFCNGMIPQMPSGRSLLLHQTCGLRKMYAARGLVLTTELALTKAVKIFITVSLSYRLYDWIVKGNSDFVEFRALFSNNSEKGISSLARLLLANFEPTWLYLLITSPAIIGVLKGLWDTRKSGELTESAIDQLEEAVNHHTNALFKKCYLWKDILRQVIPMPGFSSVSERVQKAEQQICWDGRITSEQRASLFSNIECLALHGSGMSKINAMQSLAKIVHSLSIKDFHQLQQAGYAQETLIQILRIKTQALHDLKMLSNRARLQPEEVEQSLATALQQSLVSTLYANYLLWWLGMNSFKYSPLFWSFKLGKLALEGLFIKALVKSILDVINCPDKKGFKMFVGTFELWANDLTPECFQEFVRQFRSLYTDELFQPFLAQLNNFDFREMELIDLSHKSLTSNETIAILNILKNKNVSLKALDLSSNKIHDTAGLLFPSSLRALSLDYNNIGAEGAKKLRLPSMLQSLKLWGNNIGAEGAQGLTLPESLQFLDLSSNSISDEGARDLQLPLSLHVLNLQNNNIGVEGAKGLHLPSMLQDLVLGNNNISDEGAKGLQLPSSLQYLGLWNNNIGAEGAKGLQLLVFSSLRSLNLGQNNIGSEGIQGLQLPTMLQDLSLGDNNIGAEGAKGLQLLVFSSLRSLDLSRNNISDEGAKGLSLLALSSLTSLDLSWNNIGVEGIKGLQLPPMLRDLTLWGNNIGAEGANGLEKLAPMLQTLHLGYNNIGVGGTKGLQFPPMLHSLILYGNNIGDEGAKRLQLPASLQSLDLRWNNISNEGAKTLPFLAPSSLISLDLAGNNIGDEGAKGLPLLVLSKLQYLYLSQDNIGDEGARGLQLPASLQSLDLRWNNISNEGVNALLGKIPKTKLTTIWLDGNPYNSSTISPYVVEQRIMQQQILLRKCQNQLCYPNTPLSQQNEYQTSDAIRVQPPLFFSWLKKPFGTLSEYVSNCISATLDSLGTRLEKVLSQSPSYFPNIHSFEINDWPPSASEPVMLHQFKVGRSSTLLLAAPQTAIQLPLNTIAR